MALFCLKWHFQKLLLLSRQRPSSDTGISFLTFLEVMFCPQPHLCQHYTLYALNLLASQREQKRRKCSVCEGKRGGVWFPFASVNECVTWLPLQVELVSLFVWRWLVNTVCFSKVGHENTDNVNALWLWLLSVAFTWTFLHTFTQYTVCVWLICYQVPSVSEESLADSVSCAAQTSLFYESTCTCCTRKHFSQEVLQSKGRWADEVFFSLSGSKHS